MKFLVAALLMMLASLAQATDFLPVDDAFQLTVERQDDQLRLHWQIADNYYLYRDQHRIQAMDGAELGAVDLSAGAVEKYDPTFDQQMVVFYHSMAASYPVRVDRGQIEVMYQGCADAGLCYPPQKRRFDLNGVALANPGGGVGAYSAFDSTSLISLSADGRNGSELATALVFAMIGGLILNLMPCVFPVLSLKALQLAQHSAEPGPGETDHSAIAHGWLYTAGVVFSFMLVALAVLTLRTLGDWVGWGFQLQSPGFVAALVLLFFVLALAMSGFIDIAGRWMGAGQSLASRAGWSGSFFTGVLATLVATPCTAPLMGTAIGYALSQPLVIGLTIFAVMGLGLALPILVLSYLPGLGRLLPKPGAWMVTFRQLMAFPLFATVLWLLWILIELTEPVVVMTAGLGLLLLTLVLWASRWATRLEGAPWWLLRGAQLALAVWALSLVFAAPQPNERWPSYDAASLQRYQANGEAVFVDVTAAWCITCKANEAVALSGESFDHLVQRTGVHLMRADWTRPSLAVDRLIDSYGRNGVPLYIFYSADGSGPQLLPQILTPGLVATAFESL